MTKLEMCRETYPMYITVKIINIIWEEGRSPGDQGEGQSLLEPSPLCRRVLLQWGAMEAAEEVHHTGPAGPGHGEAKSRGADPGRGPMSGGGAPGDKRSAGWPAYSRNFPRGPGWGLCLRHLFLPPPSVRPAVSLRACVPGTVTSLFLPLLFLCACSVTQSRRTLCDPMDYSPEDSSIHGILQARILEQVAMSSNRSARPRDQTRISFISRPGRWSLYHWTTFLCFCYSLL